MGHCACRMGGDAVVAGGLVVGGTGERLAAGRVGSGRTELWRARAAAVAVGGGARSPPGGEAR